jgi:hypothetical protein
MFADDAEPRPSRNAPAGGAAPRRWLCRCSTPPILLATLEGDNVNLKIRDRYYHIEGVRGRIRAICPKCGQQHTIQLGNDE